MSDAQVGVSLIGKLSAEFDLDSLQDDEVSLMKELPIHRPSKTMKVSSLGPVAQFMDVDVQDDQDSDMEEDEDDGDGDDNEDDSPAVVSNLYLLDVYMISNQFVCLGKKSCTDSVWVWGTSLICLGVELPVM